MSYFEDFIEDGFCCAGCGEFLGEEAPGYTQLCESCEEGEDE